MHAATMLFHPTARHVVKLARHVVHASLSVSNTFDYIIIGAGSAGCVLTYHLAAAGKRVCLVEAGPSNETWKVHMPAYAMSLFGDEVYNYHTEPQSALRNRRNYWPRGKVVGGSGSINGMVRLVSFLHFYALCPPCTCMSTIYVYIQVM
jgi:hypothetical protein